MTVEIGPRVFVSYSHDSEEHRQRVLDLADRLVKEGLDCWIDRYVEHATPERGWPAWMEENVRVAKYVLVVCSETYLKRYEAREEQGKGLGVKFESVLLTQHIYDNDSVNLKIIPIIFDKNDAQFIPSPLKPYTHYSLTREGGYESLYRRLTDQPEIVRPAVGTRIVLPTAKNAALSLGEAETVDNPLAVDVISFKESTSAVEAILPLIPDFTDTMHPNPNLKIAQAFFGQTATRRFSIASQLGLLEPGESSADINREEVSSQILLRAKAKGLLDQLWSKLFNEALDPNPFKR